ADAIESFSQPFILFDAEDRVVLANSRYCALVGVKEVRPGTPFLELLRTTTGAQQFARDADNSAAYIRQRLADHHAPRPPFEVELADGTWLLIIEQKTGDGGTASIFADITPLKRRHTELECQARLLQAAVTAGSEVELAEHALDAIAELQRFGAELKGGILLALDHPGARVELIAQRGLEGRFVGDSATAADGAYPCLCGRPVEFASPIHGVMPQEMHYAIPLARGRQAIGALVLYAAPGRRHLEENVAFLRTLADILGLGFDGCRRRRELLNARDMAQAANRSKSDFLAHVSHELRTPLNAIIGFSEIIAAQTFGPIGQARYLDYVHDILMSGRHLLSVVNDILDLSRIEAGRFTLHETDDMVDRLVQSTVRVMRQRVADAHLAFETTVAENLPPYRCDGIKIKQILLNLLSNAVKFTARGGRVSLAVRRAENGDLVMIVSDSGIGMRREDIPVAFEAFRQIDNAFVRRVEGTGLGLPLTRALAALHGGSLEIESEPGLGTTATVRLPARRFMAL
ncbi:MAG: hypothetical protein FJX47_18690, partial [Alphaproteobacteria bacterium]|nr:hypothetical protein [Alphaproteobacteria bacterium]